MTLKATQDTALANLQTLLTLASTGLRHRYTDMPDSINDLPALVMVDRGMMENRHGQWREIEWDIEFQLFVQIGTLARALETCRDIRADIIDQLGTDITLGGAVTNSYWREPMRLTGLELATVEYAGVTGIYTLVIKEARTFA